MIISETQKHILEKRSCGNPYLQSEYNWVLTQKLQNHDGYAIVKQNLHIVPIKLHTRVKTLNKIILINR